MKRFQKPFVHYVVQNFLSPKAYDHLQFTQKQSDLFHFYQTNELVDEPSIAFFKDQLNSQFSQLQPLANTFYNIFASYYFQGDYLLCHDDVIDDRKYAFSYYLEDHPSADLALYDETATKIIKRIKVTKNTLAIFEVSNISYHQVALCKTDGRKAVTGWLNQKGQGAKRATKVIPAYVPSIPKDLIKFKLDEDLISSEEYYRFPNTEYIFDVVAKELAGPFYAKKATKLTLSQYVVLDLKGTSLFSADFYHFKKGDYLLLNDSVNSLGDNIIDVFLLQLPKGTSKAEGAFITIIDEEGKVTGGIPYQNDVMFIVQRGKKNYYIDLVEEDIYLAHLIYRKNIKTKKGISNQSEIRNVKSLRQKLIEHHKQLQQEHQQKRNANSNKKRPIKKQEKMTVRKRSNKVKK